MPNSHHLRGGVSRPVLVLYLDSDRDQTEPYTYFLEKAGIRTNRSAFSGSWTELPSKTKRKITRADACLLFLTNAACESPVLTEMVQTIGRAGCKMICVYLENCVMAPGLHLLLDSNQAVNAYSFQNLQDVIHVVSNSLTTKSGEGKGFPAIVIAGITVFVIAAAVARIFLVTNRIRERGASEPVASEASSSDLLPGSSSSASDITSNNESGPEGSEDQNSPASAVQQVKNDPELQAEYEEILESYAHFFDEILAIGGYSSEYQFCLEKYAETVNQRAFYYRFTELQYSFADLNGDWLNDLVIRAVLEDGTYTLVDLVLSSEDGPRQYGEMFELGRYELTGSPVYTLCENYYLLREHDSIEGVTATDIYRLGTDTLTLDGFEDSFRHTNGNYYHGRDCHAGETGYPDAYYEKDRISSEDYYAGLKEYIPLDLTYETVEAKTDAGNESNSISGSCGEDVQWELTESDTELVLTVRGTGVIEKYSEHTEYGNRNIEPWTDYKTRITDLVIEEGITGIGANAFEGFTMLQSVSFPEETLASIGLSAFYGCSSLKSIELPGSVEELAASCFSDCVSLESVLIKDGIRHIPESAFNSCTGLESVDCGNVTSIGMFAFYGCTSLKEVRIRETTTEIGTWAFRECGSGALIYFYGDPPNMALTTEGEADLGIFKDTSATVFYPEDRPGWNDSVKSSFSGSLTWKIWKPE